MSQKYRLHQVDVLVEQEIFKYQQGKWKRRWLSLLEILNCSRRIACLWLFISLFASAIYAVVIYFALLTPAPFLPGPNNLPFFHIPLEYNITLRFDEDYTKDSLRFTGKTRILFQSTVITPNFLINVGDNIEINQLYFENYPFAESFSAIKYGFDSEAQVQTYVINHVFEEQKRYVAVIDFDGYLFPSNAVGRTPKLYSFTNNNTKSFAITHINKQNADFGLRYITPSFDSSTYPSKFYLQIQRPQGYHSTSNMPVIGSELRNGNLAEDIFLPSVTLFPTQLAFAVTNLQQFSKKNCHSNMNVTIHYRTSISKKIDPKQRLLQLAANSATYNSNIGKIDGIMLPNAETTEQPGITIMDEDSSIKSAQKLSDKIQFSDNC